MVRPLARALTVETDETVAHWSTAIRYGVAIALATSALLLRQPGVSALDTLWAEDGRVFLADAVNRPFLDVVLAPYMGYALVLPRLLAEAVGHLPIDVAAAALSGGSALIVAMLAAFVYRATSCLRNDVVRIAHASTMILLPVTAREALNNASNLHWFLMFAAFWALVWAPRGWPLRIVSTGVVTLAALTDPLTLLLGPVLALRLIALRGVGDHLVTAGWTAGLAVQFLIAVDGIPAQTATPTVLDLAGTYGARVIAVNLLGIDLSQRLWSDLGGAATLIGIGLALAVGAWAATRPGFGMRAVALAGLTVSALMFAVTHVIRWTDKLAAADTWTSYLDGSRYHIIPALLFLSVVALLLDQRDSRIPQPRWDKARLGILVWGVAVAAMSFSMPNGRDAGPSWQEELTRARETCTGSSIERVDIPITPSGWTVTIGCHEVGG